jgi:hypothetical protein
MLKETIQNNLEAIVDYLNSLNNNELIDIHNQYCQTNNCFDDEIFSNDEEFFNTFFHNAADKAVRATFYGDYSYGHDFVQFNGYGNLESFDDASDFISIIDIANSILENPDDYYIELNDESAE